MPAIVAGEQKSGVFSLMEDNSSIFIDKKQALLYRVNRAFALLGLAGGLSLAILVSFCLNYFSAREVTTAASKLMPTLENKLAAPIASGEAAALNSAFESLAGKLVNLAYLALLNEKGELVSSCVSDGNLRNINYKRCKKVSV